MNIATARSLLVPVVRAYRALDASVAAALTEVADEYRQEHRRAAGRVMGYIVSCVFMPVFHQHPELEAFSFSGPEAEPSLQPEFAPLLQSDHYVRTCLAEALRAASSIEDPEERSRYELGINETVATIEALTEALALCSRTPESGPQ